jgi:hypothetical protein
MRLDNFIVLLYIILPLDDHVVFVFFGVCVLDGFPRTNESISPSIPPK